MSKAYAYVRVSGIGQVRGDGLERQERAVKKYAKAHSLEIVKVFREEGVSGTLEERPQLARLMVRLEENGEGVDTVIIERLDRLARDLMVQEAIIDDLNKQGFKLVSATEGDDLLSSDPTRKLVRQVLGAIAEYDKTMTVLKLRTARERKRSREGKCEGRKGYLETDKQLVHEIKLLRRRPKRGRRKTFEEIARILNERGRLTQTGKPFTGKIVSNIIYRC